MGCTFKMVLSSAQRSASSIGRFLMHRSHDLKRVLKHGHESKIGVRQSNGSFLSAWHCCQLNPTGAIFPCCMYDIYKEREYQKL